MKKTSAKYAAIYGLLLALLAGLSTTGLAAANTPQHSNVVDKQVASQHSATPNKYAIAGIDQPKKFEAFFVKFQTLVAKGDKKGVADYMKYPVVVNGKKTTNRTKKQFIKNYDKIFTPKVKKALADQKVEDLFVNAQGVMVGDGEIWFGVSTQKPEQYQVIDINK
ncbi:hypothetical protein DFP93_101125 [Aneurinibacillus soli]|uniref:Uncharacterized protein n=1 Tax=Aneurinibacillus soli TaxID=1500254 RepID=A0A0U5AWD0_9BACL|nr:hypothetical protein [Aneurinibacillus soli]PYE64100.1 hypothetical protein DFP93_101125 [Aneurinibacillus soli]BAU28049.1 hypothetical protein CB4_02223 [Aneurinibacillus soli]